MREAFTNREIRTGNAVSGNIYVAAVERGDTHLEKIFVATANRCGHVNRICVDCAHQWGWDYQLRFEATIGGRRLAEDLERLGRDPHEIANGRGVDPSASDTDVTRGRPRTDDHRWETTSDLGAGDENRTRVVSLEDTR